MGLGQIRLGKRGESGRESRRFRGGAVLLQATRKSSPLSTWDGPGGHGVGPAAQRELGGHPQGERAKRKPAQARCTQP